ncbi:hypothetical protein A2943_00100 [Candidatus Adlerbacteria bacterium RIFCSPLOWO2_01_FULL_51_16]|uniref:Nucleotidyl transferase domain-containing protein n=1 Tax=Candidatus Adlerbacteria bacterium RIFCSPLOWO2_01_FULL_51_16 TaxID=1797243 RepID=A0A1F4XFA3_9BACT|nr:MAG: hypothetical protein A2943_00100 [Candidatus Adlerbacteria bacterium RIFCSPLOWO2_01_FULL_51_16]
MQAVILAGGLGNRLRPITLEIPKPLVPVKKRPILNHHVAFLINGGVEEIFVIVNIAEAADYDRWIKTWSDEPWMARVRVVYEKESRGTFGSLQTVLPMLNKERLIISNGDSLMDFDMQELIRSHTQGGTLVTTALGTTEDPYEYGVAIIQDGRIERFTKNPAEPNSGHISMGLYVVEPAVLELLEDRIQSFEYDVLTALSLQKENNGGIMKNSRFYECGTLSRWERAIKEW